jgi:hypothetical protein
MSGREWQCLEAVIWLTWMEQKTGPGYEYRHFGLLT